MRPLIAFLHAHARARGGALVLALAACGGQQIPEGAGTTVISLQKIDCAECGHEIVADLRQRPGVYDAKFDRRRAEIRVTASRSFDVYRTVKQLAANEGFEALLGGGKGLYLDWSKFPEGADVKTIARGGQDVPDLATHLVRGKVTVIDFSAIWCEPCRKVDEHMAQVLARRSDIAYRKLDIGDWDTPLAQRYLRAVPQLPYMIVYSGAGEQIDAISGLETARLDAAIDRAAAAAAAGERGQ